MTAEFSPEAKPAVDEFGLVLDCMSRSLTVDLIASRPLQTCNGDEIAQAVFRRTGFGGIDQVPVLLQGSIAGVLQRNSAEASAEPASACMRGLSEVMLVESTTGILPYVHLAAESPYHLVVKRERIDGIVTRSDLLKLPVRLVLFAYLTHLESTMASVIRRRCPDESWRRHLNHTRRSRLEGALRLGQRGNVYVEPLCYTQWCDKRTILAAVLYEGLPEAEVTFNDELRQLETLRHRVMHTNEYLTDPRQLSALLRTAESRILHLESQADPRR